MACWFFENLPQPWTHKNVTKSIYTEWKNLQFTCYTLIPGNVKLLVVYSKWYKGSSTDPGHYTLVRSVILTLCPHLRHIHIAGISCASLSSDSFFRSHVSHSSHTSQLSSMLVFLSQPGSVPLRMCVHFTPKHRHTRVTWTVSGIRSLVFYEDDERLSPIRSAELSMSSSGPLPRALARFFPIDLLPVQIYNTHQKKKYLELSRVTAGVI